MRPRQGEFDFTSGQLSMAAVIPVTLPVPSAPRERQSDQLAERRLPERAIAH